MPATQTFAQLGLPDALVSALAKRGMTEPFAIQAAALPDALTGKDVLGKAQTGSGKTLAFGLPMLTRLSGRRAQPTKPLALVLVPTRELAMQVHDALQPLAQPLGVRLTVVVGGVNMGRQITALRRGVDVVIATPGRLEDLISQRVCDLSSVDLVVLDEADHMCDMGFLPVVRRILDQVRPDGQRLLFSATLDQQVQSIVTRYLKNAVTHSTMPVGVAVAAMDHHVLVVTHEDKIAVTTEIANREGRTLLFVRTKHGADRLTKQLRRAGVHAEALHGGKTQGARTRTLTDFREGRCTTLVATDVAARGIHVDGIDLVLHVDPAADHKDSLHRAGRTARAGETGTVVSLVTMDQERATAKMVRLAGVTAPQLRVRPGHADLIRVTGARAATGGVPLAETSASDNAPRHHSAPPRRPGTGNAPHHRAARNGARNGSRQPARSGRR